MGDSLRGLGERLYAVTILLSTIGEDYVYYFFLSFLEAPIALLIVWCAWKWPE